MAIAIASFSMYCTYIMDFGTTTCTRTADRGRARETESERREGGREHRPGETRWGQGLMLLDVAANARASINLGPKRDGRNHGTQAAVNGAFGKLVIGAIRNSSILPTR